MTKYAFMGIPGCIHHHKTLHASTTAYICSQASQEIKEKYKPIGYRYVVVCNEHEEKIYSQSTSAAKHLASSPELWCNTCCLLASGPQCSAFIKIGALNVLRTYTVHPNTPIFISGIESGCAEIVSTYNEYSELRSMAKLYLSAKIHNSYILSLKFSACRGTLALAALHFDEKALDFDPGPFPAVTFGSIVLSIPSVSV
ncbi:hypothetical protein HGH92_26530 [Chitinophaga varians]|uniref:Uncharacterized protein n=1 Tax=Chitinophaga varians TaxID=2202339 RepID=A0A847RLK8_9BACT|nr:hypothetical protein [Chitinophaga varians]NLR67889.1 hypothetical protein [Chitinophaga varians]